jgi:uncharacterized protein (DUF1697 family)
MAGRHVALIRGINVGRAKRVAMADLRALVERLGYVSVRTLLNSGNVVFTIAAGAPRGGDPAARIEKAMAASLGVSARVTVLSAKEMAVVVAENALAGDALDPSRLMVSFFRDPAAERKRLAPLAKDDWAPEKFILGTRAAYISCPKGILESRAAAAAFKILGDAVTSRNWATVTKLHALLEDPES